MQGLFANPVAEGIVLLLIGIGCYIVGGMLHDPDLHSLGQVVVGVGLGYTSHAGIQAARQ